MRSRLATSAVASPLVWGGGVALVVLLACESGPNPSPALTQAPTGEWNGPVAGDETAPPSGAGAATGLVGPPQEGLKTVDFAAPPPASAAERCTGGLDEDGDGLVDCEDADCVLEHACAEDCDDSSDNDLDGLVDCADSECWPTLICARMRGIRSKVLRANVANERRLVTFDWYTSSSYIADKGVATGVSGIVSYLVEPGMSFDEEEYVRRCTWHVAEHQFTRYQRLRASGYGHTTSCTNTVTDLTFNTSCALTTSAFLPDCIGSRGGSALFGDPRGVTGAEARHWYIGEVTRLSTTTVRSSTSGGGSTIPKITKRQMLSLEAGSSGDSMMTTPTEVSWSRP